MTKNLKLFTLFCLVWSVPFYAFLQTITVSQDGNLLILAVACILYAIGFAITSTYLGNRDSARDARFALPVRYGVTATLSSMLMGGIWLAGWQSGDKISPYIYAALTV